MDKRSFDIISPITKFIAIGGFGYLLLNIIRIVSENSTDSIISLFIFFIVITLINILFIGKGCMIISECAARFTLDCMPSKLMEIEANFNSEKINKRTMENMKLDVQRDVDYIGSLDELAKIVSRTNKVIILVYFPITMILGIFNIFNILLINNLYINNILICGTIMEIFILLIFIYISRLATKFTMYSKEKTL